MEAARYRCKRPRKGRARKKASQPQQGPGERRELGRVETKLGRRGEKVGARGDQQEITLLRELLKKSTNKEITRLHHREEAVTFGEKVAWNRSGGLLTLIKC